MDLYDYIGSPGFATADDCKIACVNISACGFRGYEFSPGAGSCNCLYEAEQLPGNLPDGWNDFPRDQGTGVVNDSQEGGDCAGFLCHVYMVSYPKFWTSCYSTCAPHHASQWSMTTLSRMVIIAARKPPLLL